MTQRINSRIVKLSEIKGDRETKGIHGWLLPVTRTIEYFRFGNVFLYTGKTNAGKSTIANLDAVAFIEQGYKVGIFSGEQSTLQLRDWLITPMAGNNMDEIYIEDIKKKKKVIKKEVRKSIIAYYDEYIDIIEAKDTKINEYSLFKNMEDLVDQGTKVFMIDNAMIVNYMDNYNQFEGEREFFFKLVEFAKKHKLIIQVVKHPNKRSTKDVGTDGVSGFGDLANVVQFQFSIEEITYEEKNDPDDELRFGMDRLIHIKKNRETGEKIIIQCKWLPDKRRLISAVEKYQTRKNYVFNWERSF